MPAGASTWGGTELEETSGGLNSRFKDFVAEGSVDRVDTTLVLFHTFRSIPPIPQPWVVSVRYHVHSFRLAVSLEPLTCWGSAGCTWQTAISRSAPGGEDHDSIVRGRAIGPPLREPAKPRRDLWFLPLRDMRQPLQPSGLVAASRRREKVGVGKGNATSTTDLLNAARLHGAVL
ncbi:uncharacterized protein CTRU02_201281 [Colletotrichum truncatum]|uniref:Uncharacterized protein n=1 Tax=Colletotrichum truncatum TaxID=5467 RepID=A0ACC3ZH75_COLTU